MRLKTVLAAAAFALTSTALLAQSSASGPAPVTDDVAHRTVGALAEFAHSTEDLWRAVLAARRSSDTSQDELVRSAFSLAGGGRLAATRLSAHGATRAESDEIMRSLDGLVALVDDTMDRAPTTGEIRRTWDNVRASWRNLQDRVAGVPRTSGTTGPTGSTGGATGSTGGGGVFGPDTSGTTGPTAPQPRVDIAAAITEARWSGMLNPDLRVAGTFTGKGLTKADITVKDGSGKVVTTDGAKLTAAVAQAMSGKSASTEVSVNWSYSFENEDLASGENTIVVTVTDSKGRKAVAETSLVRRQF